MGRKPKATIKHFSWELRVKRRDERVRRFQLVGSDITIGRSSDCDVVLPNAAVSRNHARLEVSGNAFSITDLGSRNGVEVTITCALGCNALAEEVGLQLHLGLHAGDVIQDGGNVYGGAVNIAARVASASAPGEVLVSETVRALSRTSVGVTFEDRGSHALKGVAEPQRLFAVHQRRP